MFISTLSIAVMVIASVLTGLFLIFLLAGSKYNNMIAPLDSKDFPLCDLYGVGFVLLDLFRHSYVTKAERKRRQQMVLIYGEQHSEYYLRVHAAQRVTYAFLLVVAGFNFYGLANDYLILGVFLLFAFVAYYYSATLPQEKLNKKSALILSDFADVASRLTLLVNAGMIMREAWDKVAYAGNSELYQEMQLTSVNIHNGMSEIDAYTEFGARCLSPEIKKFSSTIVQGLVKGNRELVEMIKQQSSEIWDAKRHRARRQGESAASKLLIPICIMFLGIIIIVIVPIFANLSV